ncbi:MAG: hypothetical protein ABUK01_03555 [Leptospirales bacterium]
MSRLLDGIHYDSGSGIIDRSGAEEIALLYIDLAVHVKKNGRESIESWIHATERPILIREALEGIYLGISGSEIRERHRAEIREAGLYGTELLETIVAAEGAALIADNENPSYTFEYIASLFGEEYFSTFKNNLKKLYTSWSK